MGRTGMLRLQHLVLAAMVAVPLLVSIQATEIAAGVLVIESRHLDSALILAKEKAEGRGNAEGRGLPENSWIEKVVPLGEKDGDCVVAARLFTPWARAARVAAAAARGAVQLEAKVWNPDIFNTGVLLVVEGWRTADSSAVQIQDVVCLADGVLLEPIWGRADTLKTATKTTQAPSIYYQALLPLGFIQKAEDTQIFVSTNLGDVILVITGTELSELR